MDLTPLALTLGFFIGMTLGFTGIGGGILLFPTLTSLFGVNPVAALGVCFTFSFITRLGALVSHFRVKNVQVRLGLIVGMGGIPAIITTSLLLNGHKDDPGVQLFVRIAFGVVLAICLATMLFVGAPKPSTGDDGTLTVKTLPAVLCGVLIGTVVGLTSVGGGILVIPLLIRVFSVPIRQAIGTCLLISVLIAISGAFMLRNNVELSLVLKLLGGGIPGVFVGAQLQRQVSEEVIRWIVVGLMVVAGLSQIFG